MGVKKGILSIGKSVVVDLKVVASDEMLTGKAEVSMIKLLRVENQR